MIIRTKDKEKNKKLPEKDIKHFHVSPLRFPKAFLFSTGHSCVSIVFVFVFCLFVCFKELFDPLQFMLCPESQHSCKSFLPGKPSSLSRGLFADSVTTSLPLRLANLSEPTATTALPQPQAACLAAARRSYSLEVTMPLLQVPITWRSTAPPGEIPLLRLPPCRELVLLPLVNRLAVTMTTAWPRAWMTPDLTPLPASPKSVWVPAAFAGLRFACQFEAALLLTGCRGLGLESLGCREVSSLP